MPGSDKSKETPEDLAPGERLPVDPDFGPRMRNCRSRTDRTSRRRTSKRPRQPGIRGR